jgi:HPt (histidine-containing phosphotransfer) domain-containing protein
MIRYFYIHRQPVSGAGLLRQIVCCFTSVAVKPAASPGYDGLPKVSRGTINPAVACPAFHPCPAGQSNTTMPDDQVIDPAAIANLRDLSPDDGQEFLRELIGVYLEDTPLRLVELEQAMARQDALTLSKAAHTIKGSSSNFGATRLSKLAQEIELQGKSGNLAATAPLCVRLRAEYDLVAAALGKILADK